MKFISIIYIGLFLLLGEAIQSLLKLTVPGSIFGMILIFSALKLKWIRLKQVQPASNILLKYLGLFFIPYGVVLLNQYHLIEEYLLKIIIAVIVSTLLSMAITSFIFSKLNKNG